MLADFEAAEVFFLNARRGRGRTEYLGYHPGRVVERTDLGDEQRALLARVLGMEVDSGQVEQWAASSQAEEPPLPSPVPEEPTRRRLGEFELLSELGRGGMGIVYRAWQPSLGRQVALKCMLKAGDPKADARFNREIHALGRVEHPNLVKVFTSGAEAERWFYAMELVEGATLAAVCGQLQSQGSGASDVDLATWHASLSTACKAAREAERPLSNPDDPDPRPDRSTPAPPAPPQAGNRDYVRHVVELVRQVAEAAHALHEAGVIHRDIKPDNILLGPDGSEAVLMDLGLAQLADESEGRLTRTRQFVGTLRYASPEQVLSVPLDRRSDVYSLGATLWELLTLRPLFGATDQTPTHELMLTIQSTDPEAPRRLNPQVPEDLEAIVLGSRLESRPISPLRHGIRAGCRPVALAAGRAGAGPTADARLPPWQGPAPPQGVRCLAPRCCWPVLLGDRHRRRLRCSASTARVAIREATERGESHGRGSVRARSRGPGTPGHRRAQGDTAPAAGAERRYCQWI